MAAVAAAEEQLTGGDPGTTDANVLREVLLIGRSLTSIGSGGMLFSFSRLSSSLRVRHSSGVFPCAIGQPDTAKCIA